MNSSLGFYEPGVTLGPPRPAGDTVTDLSKGVSQGQGPEEGLRRPAPRTQHLSQSAGCTPRSAG